RRRVLELLRFGGAALAAGLAAMLGTCVMDRWLALPAGVRLVLLIAVSGTALGILLWPLRKALRGRPDWLAAAGEIERGSPMFRQRLTTAVSQMLDRPEYRGSPAFLARLMDEIERTIPRVAAPRFATRRIVLPWALAAAFALA